MSQISVAQLASHLTDPAIHKLILGDYNGPYALGVARLPDGEHALRVRVTGTHTAWIQKEITVHGWPVKVIATGNFQAPEVG